METWKIIENTESNYMVSTEGRVKSLHYGKEKILKYGYRSTGYPCVGINVNGIRKFFTVHRLVAMAFLPNPVNKSDVNHIDGNKKNCRLENLEWATRKENIRHAIEIGLNNHQKKLTKEDVLHIRQLLKIGGYEKIATIFGVKKCAIRDIAKGVTWKRVF